MPALEGTLDLDIGPALAAIDAMAAAANAALDGINSTAVSIVIDVDTGQIEGAATALADLGSTAPAVVIDVDPTLLDAAQEQINALSGSALVGIEVDDSALTEAAGTLAQFDTVSVALDVDTSDVEVATAQVEALGAAGPTVAIDVDTSEVAGAVEEVDALGDAVAGVPDLDIGSSGIPQITSSAQEATTATHGLGEEGAGLAGAFGTGISVAKGNVSGLTGLLGTAAAPIAGVAAGLTALFTAGERSIAADERLNLVFGDTAERVKDINIGGLNGSLSDLALRAGSSGAQLKQASANLGQLAQSAGASTDETVTFTQSVDALALRAVAMNPALGQAGDVAGRLSTALARGGRFAAAYGLGFLNVKNITDRATESTGKAANELTIYDKAAAGAALATEHLGDSLGSDFQKGAEQSSVVLARLKAELSKGLAEAGRPLVEPILDALTELVPVGVEVAHALGDAAKVFVEPLKLAAPLLGDIASLLGALPVGPIVTAAAAFLTFQTAARLGILVAGRFADVAGTVAAKLGATSAAGRLDGFAIGARNVDTSTGAMLRLGAGSRATALATAETERAASRLTVALAGETEAAQAAAVANGRNAAAERAAALSATGAEAGHISAAGALTVEELAAINATGGLGSLTVSERLAAVQAAALAGDVELTQAALSTFGIKIQLTTAQLEILAVAAGEAGVSALGAGEKAAASGAGFSKMLGTIGLVVGVAFALGSALGVFGGKADAAAESTKAFKARLGEAGDELLGLSDKAYETARGITAVSESIVVDLGKGLQESLGPGFSETFAAAGVSYQQLAGAIAKGGPDFDRLRDRLLDQAEALGASPVKIEALRTSLDGLRESSQQAAEETAKLAATQIFHNDATDIGAVAALHASGQWGLLNKEQQRVGLKLLDTAHAAQAAAGATDSVGTAAAEAAVKVDTAAEALDKQTSAIRDATSALAGYLGQPLTAAEQQIQLAEDTNSLTEAFAANGKALDVHSKEGLANSKTLDELAKHANDAAVALAKTGDLDGARASMASYRQALITTATQAGFTGAEAEALADKWGLIPDNVTTGVETTGSGEAFGIADRWNTLAKDWPPSVVTAIKATDDATEKAKIAKTYIDKLKGPVQAKYQLEYNSIIEAQTRYDRLHDTPNVQKYLDLTVRVNGRQVPIGPSGQPIGGLIPSGYGFAEGGVVDYFARGTERHVAQVAPAGALRVWAEPETQGEAYIPLALAKRPRSTAILGQVAERFGLTVSADAPQAALPGAQGLVGALAGLTDTTREAAAQSASLASAVGHGLQVQVRTETDPRLVANTERMVAALNSLAGRLGPTSAPERRPTRPAGVNVEKLFLNLNRDERDAYNEGLDRLAQAVR